MLRIKLVKSPIGQNPKNRATTQALGLNRIGVTVEKEDTPSIRGMVHAIHHMVQAWDGETMIHDGTQVRKKATRKGRKPSEKRGADK